MIGQTIGNYRITSELARGGMGVVYRAQHLTLPREVVIKAILSGSFNPQTQEHLRARFLREAYIQSQMDHPNIVRVYEFLAVQDNYYMVMEFVAGMSLRDLLQQQRRMAVTQALQLFKQILTGMEYAHTFNYVDQSGRPHVGIVHRDIKPANILLDGRMHVKISDFGIVKTAGESGMTQTGFNPGTVEYMSPEQIKGYELDARSDIYSLGVTLYEMLAGRLPFESSATGSDYEIRRGHVELAPPALNQLRPELAAELVTIVNRSLAKNPAERFQTTREFLEAIQRYEQTATTANEVAALPATPPTQAVRVAKTASAAPATATEQVAPARGDFAATIPANAAASAKATTSSSRAGLFVGLAAVLLLAVGAGVYFMRGDKPETAKQVTTESAKETSANKPAPTAETAGTVANNVPRTNQTPTISTNQSETSEIRQAREYVGKENYREAIALYQNYVTSNPNAADAGEINTRIARLKKMVGLLATAKLAMGQRDFEAAARDFEEALQINPDSVAAKAGLALAREAMSRQANRPGALRRQ